MPPKALHGHMTRDHRRDLEAHGGVPIEAVSRALRHRTTKTTEAFYARIRADDAFREIDRAFERPSVKVGPT